MNERNVFYIVFFMESKNPVSLYLFTFVHKKDTFVLMSNIEF